MRLRKFRRNTEPFSLSKPVRIRVHRQGQAVPRGLPPLPPEGPGRSALAPFLQLIRNWCEKLTGIVHIPVHRGASSVANQALRCAAGRATLKHPMDVGRRARDNSRMRDFQNEGLCHDPIHGYISFTTGEAPRADGPSAKSSHGGGTSERSLIDHPWVQRLRQIHQLQTAWWVFPTAEHTRFQHVLGVMHLASRAVGRAVRQPAPRSAPTCPAAATSSRWCGWPACCTTWGTARSATFFDEHFLADYGLTHETLGSRDHPRRAGRPAPPHPRAIPTAGWPTTSGSIPRRSPF